jgi:predicted nuclease with TOPRIM domain
LGVLQNRYIRLIMGYAKERGKLEKISETIKRLEIYNDKNLVLLTDGYEKYSHTVRILKNKAPDLFEELYKNDLQAVKEAKKSVKESETEEARQENFIQFKNSVLKAVENTVAVTLST